MARTDLVRHKAALFCLAAGIAFLAVPAALASPLTIKAGPTRLTFLPGDPETQAVTVWLTGGSKGALQFRLVDAVPNPDGGFLDAPFGSTPNSLDGYIQVGETELAYLPSDSEQQFSLPLTIDPSRVDKPRFGTIIVTLIPDSGEGEGVSIQATGAVALQVLAAPSGEALASLPESRVALSLRELTLRAASPWTVIDQTFPDLPWVLNHGPAEITALGANTGSVLLEQRVTYEFLRLSPLQVLSEEAGSPLYTAGNVPRLLLAGQAYRDTMSSEIRLDSGARVDAMPLIGFVRVRATAAGGLSGLNADPVSRSITFLVFPWKESLFLFLVWLFRREWRHRKGREVRLREDGKPHISPPARIRERIGSVLGRLTGR